MTDFKLKCTNFGWGSVPDPAGGAYSAPPSWIWGAASWQRKGRELEVEGPKLLLNQGPSEPSYATSI